jgi:hypothetical protein
MESTISLNKSEEDFSSEYDKTKFEVSFNLKESDHDPEFDDSLEDDTDDSPMADEESLDSERDFLSVGKKWWGDKAKLGKMVKAIKNMEWLTLPKKDEPPLSLPMMQGLGIKGIIKELNLRNVDKIAYTNAMAPYGFYGIQDNYKKGDVKRIRLYVIDSGDSCTPVFVDKYKD